MAWFWASFKVRTTRLGTFRGGIQAFADRFADLLRRNGVEIHLSAPVKQIAPLPEGGLRVELPGKSEVFDRCLATVSPVEMARLAPVLSAEYSKKLLDLKSMGAVVLVLALKQRLSEEGYYWYNLPKSAGYPYLALVEHTNFVSADEFGGDHIVYMGDYLDPSHEFFTLGKNEIMERFLPSLPRFNPQFTRDWIKDSWLFRTTYGQPVPLLNHSQNIPDLLTSIPGLYFASMSQVYPWDRGTNFAVCIARQVVRRMISEA
jgi:protoporphyrinogen oxidase